MLFGLSSASAPHDRENPMKPVYLAYALLLIIVIILLVAALAPAGAMRI